MSKDQISSAPPAWMRDEEVDDSNEPLRVPNSSGNDQQPTPKVKKLVTVAFRFMAICLSLLMASTSAVGLSMINEVDKSGKIFVAVYMFCFALLLFAFEINQIKHIEYLDNMFKRNFGFMYSPTGNALFIIFIAFLSFGLGDPQLLSFATGASLAIFGVAKFILFLQYPEYLETQ